MLSQGRCTRHRQALRRALIIAGLERRLDDHGQANLRVSPGQRGRGRRDLGNRETRTFLEDGDAVIFRGWCEREGAARIGFGDVRATLLPA
jgi:hypothetical protein